MSKGSKRVAGSPPVSILGLEKEYENLHRVYGQLEARERGIRDDLHDTHNSHKIYTVDFSLDLEPLPPDAPIRTDSEANRFGMLVFRMLCACESGSIGGDACRIEDVLFAAADDAKDAGPASSASSFRQFDHLLGLTLAVSNHGVESWIVRGDPHNGKVFFKALGDLWKKQLGKDNDQKLADAGVSAEVRQFAIETCEGLQGYLKSFGDKKWAGTGANEYEFHFMAKRRAPRKPKPAAGDPSGSTDGDGDAAPARTAPVLEDPVGAVPDYTTEGLSAVRAFATRVAAEVARTPHTENGASTTAFELPAQGGAGGALVGVLALGKEKRKAEVSGARMLELLPGLPKTVHPVAIGSWSKVLCAVGTTPSIYAWAGFMSATLTLVLSSGMLKLRVTSRVVGTGIPSCHAQGAAPRARASLRPPCRSLLARARPWPPSL